MQTKVIESSETRMRTIVRPRSRTSCHRSSAPARNAMSAIASELTGASASSTGAGSVPSPGGPKSMPAAR